MQKITIPPGARPASRGWGFNTGREAENIPVSQLAEYLAKVNLRESRSWTYRLQSLPRPTGRTTRTIITVYDIPRQPSSIHDLDVDAHGNVWYGNSGWDYLGKLNPRTGEFFEYAAPNFLTPPATVAGIQDVQVDRENNVWAAVRGAKIAKFKPTASKWVLFDLPRDRGITFIAPFRSHTRTYWANQVGAGFVYRLDIHTGKVDTFELFEQAPAGPHAAYMTDRDSKDNLYVTDYRGSTIVKVDGRTGTAKVFPTPTSNAYPRRGAIDANDQFWFAEFLVDKVGVFDPRSEEIREFDLSRTYISPYFAKPDANGDVWISSTGSDRLLRLPAGVRSCSRVFDAGLLRRAESRS